MPAPELSAVYDRQITNLSTETRRRLLRIWDSLAPWTEAEIARFEEIAAPLIEAASQAAVDVTATYVEQSVGVARPTSQLIPADAAARRFDPSDRIGRLINDGMPFEEATAAGRNVVDALGRDTVHSSARQAFGEAAPPLGRYMRRVSGKTCQWCLRLAGTVWPSAADAEFGHAGCDCKADFAEAVEANNRAHVEAAGGTQAVKQRDRVARLKRSERIARENQERARLAQETEPDPARRERLAEREQAWETRRERKAEQVAAATAP